MSIVENPAVPEPSQVISATQTTYQAIRQMIITGELAPGEKLKIERLKDRIQTGASPIREALTLLVADKLVERIDQRGFRAAPVSQENFAEILRLRCALEDMALRESIAAADDTWEEQLVLSHHRMVRVGAADVATFEEHHKAFHMALLARCNSPILLGYCSQLYDLNVRYRYLAGRSRNYGKRDVRAEHRDILDAAVAREVDLASQRLLSHYQQTGSFLRETPDVPQDQD
ncbi:GntR family transcriptional regulator [Sagittula sp. SSi028]|uniref:GntR family transcriptional regulator n=1 Tax=Sagittula sp. SSi028 TaxID=3400636 RepID=UPI003AF58F50